jgi:hypothetical protein
MWTKGTAPCPAEDDVSVTITGETLVFTNRPLKKYTMPFNPGPDGSFGQTHIEGENSVVYYHGLNNGEML